jgi:hypothetical protein
VLCLGAYIFFMERNNVMLPKNLKSNFLNLKSNNAQAVTEPVEVRLTTNHL